MKTISAIIPVYNEEKTVGYVLGALINSGVFTEVICVNDGSTDGSTNEIKKIKNVTLINSKTNRGKGFALVSGIKKSTGDLVAFFDADLSKLSTDHIKKMIDAMSDDTDCVVAYEEGEFLSVFSGQRVYRRADLLPFLDQMKEAEYGVEVLLNEVFKGKNVKYLKLVGLGHVEKMQKYETGVAVNNYINQWFVGILKQYIKSGMDSEQLKTIVKEMSEYVVRKQKKYKKVKKL